MKCKQAREWLSDRHNGELEPGSTAELEQHLEGCAGCRRAAVELDEMMQLLGSTEPPRLPEGFGAALHERLQSASKEPVSEPAPRPVLERPLWVGVVRGVGLAVAGAAAVILVLWVSGWRSPQPSKKCAAPEAVARTGGATSGAGVSARPPERARRLRVGQVAVLELSIHAQKHHPNARLQVVLPDGLSLLGEGAAELEEKHMEWTARLIRGHNKIRIPVRAQRAGTWRLVARARASGFRTASETRLVVTRS